MTPQKEKYRVFSAGSVLLIIFLAALAVRLWGIGWDHLYPRHHDELIHLHTATVFSQGELSPRVIWENSRYPKYILYPWFSMYVVGGGYRLWSLCDQALKELISHPEELGGLEMLKAGELTPQKALLLGRIMIALMGALTVLFVYGIGRRLGNRGVGLLGAALLAFTGYHVANCHWLKNDVSTLFFLMVGVYFSVRYFDRGGIWNIVGSTLFVAMGVNSKYHVFPGFLVILAAIALRGPGGFREAVRRLLNLKSLMVIFLVVLFLILTFPLVYLDFDFFYNNIINYLFRMRSEYLVAGGQQYSTLQVWYMNLINMFRFLSEMGHGMGLPATLLGIAGLVFALWRHERRLILLAVFPVLYIPLVIFGVSPVLRLQDTVPLYPFLGLFGAVLLWRLSLFLLRRPLPAAIVFAGISCLLLYPYVQATIVMDYGYWQPDTVDYATTWAKSNIAPDRLVAREKKSIDLPASKFNTVLRRRLCVATVDQYADQGFKYLVTTSRQANRMSDPYGEYGPDHFFGRFYSELPSRYNLIKQFSMGDVPYKGGDILVWELKESHPLSPYGINSGLLRHFSADYFTSSPRILFPGPGGRCEGETGFIIGPEEREGRLLLSLSPLEIIGAEVTAGVKPGMARVRTAGEKPVLKLKSGGSGVAVFEPETGFPWINYSYRLEVSSPWNSPCLVRILPDAFRVGLAYLRGGDYQSALTWLERAASENPLDWYPPALMAEACLKLGRKKEGATWTAEANSRSPGYKKLLNKLADNKLGRREWEALFQEAVGYDPVWLAGKISSPPLEFSRESGITPPINLAPGAYLVSLEYPPKSAGGFELRPVSPDLDFPARKATLDEISAGEIKRSFKLEFPVRDLVFRLVPQDSHDPREFVLKVRPDIRFWLAEAAADLARILHE